MKIICFCIILDAIFSSHLSNVDHKNVDKHSQVRHTITRVDSIDTQTLAIVATLRTLLTSMMTSDRHSLAVLTPQIIVRMLYSDATYRLSFHDASHQVNSATMQLLEAYVK